MQKESLATSIPKLIMAVVLIVGIGAVFGMLGYSLVKKPQEATHIQNAGKLLNIEEIDIFEFIPEDSVRIQKVVEDIDNDNIEEIVLYFITDDENFLPSVQRRFGKPNFMILKSNNANDNYKIYWEYNFDIGMSYYIADKSNILIYDQKTDKPKIKFSIYEENSETHMFFYLDKKNDTFKIIEISNDDISYNPLSIKDIISVKDTGDDGIAEIMGNIERGYNYKWDDENNTYNVINSCFKINTKAHPTNTQRRIYFDERYQYEIEYPASTDIIECRDDIVRIGELQIHPPLVLEKDKIKDYECIEGVETFEGHTPSQTVISSCAKIQSNNKFEIFKKSDRNPHNAEESIVYNLIKDNNTKTFTLIQIYTGGQATTNLRSYLDDFVSTFKFIEKDETADWKTYRNGEYNYEIKYPEDWSIVTRGDYQVHFLDIENPGFDTYSEPGEGNIFITMNKSQNNQDFPSQYSSKSTIIVDGNSAVRYEGIKGGHDPLNPSIIYTSVYLIKDNNKLKFNFSDQVSDKNDDKYITIFNQILSTFKFIRQ